MIIRTRWEGGAEWMKGGGSCGWMSDGATCRVGIQKENDDEAEKKGRKKE